MEATSGSVYPRVEQSLQIIFLKNAFAPSSSIFLVKIGVIFSLLWHKFMTFFGGLLALWHTVPGCNLPESILLFLRSTDSQLKLWNVGKPHCLRSFKGHINEKNFVGLASNGDYIACGKCYSCWAKCTVKFKTVYECMNCPLWLKNNKNQSTPCPPGMLIITSTVICTVPFLLFIKIIVISSLRC